MANEKKDKIEQAVLDFQEGKDPGDSFGLIYRLSVQYVYREFKASREFDEDECLDLTQTVFLNVYKGLLGFRRDSSFHTWLMRITKNVLLDALRKRRRENAERNISLDHTVGDDGEERTLDVPDPAQESQPLNALLAEESQQRVEKAFRSLSEREYDCMILRIEGFSYKEIASSQKIAVDTVKVHLHNARKKIKTELGFDIGD